MSSKAPLIAILFYFVAVLDVRAEALRIGVIIPLSGPTASMGESIQGAFNLVKSPYLNYEIQDDQCDAKRGLAAFQKLSGEGVKVFYVACSGTILAVAPYAKKSGSLVLSTYSGSAAVRETGSEVIRFDPDAVSVARYLVHLLKSDNRFSKYNAVALMYEEQDYATSLADLLKRELGARIVDEQSYLAVQTSFKTQIVRLRHSKAEAVILIPVGDAAMHTLYREMKELGFAKPLLGEVNLCDYAVQPSAFGLKGACLSATIATPGFIEFEKRYQELNGRKSQYPFYDAITVDMLKALEQFVMKKESTSPKLLIDFILSGIKGEVTDYKFSSDGEVLDTDKYIQVREY